MSIFTEHSASQVDVKEQIPPDKMLLMPLVLVVLVSTPGLPRPESRQRRQILGTQACAGAGACSQNILSDGGLVTSSQSVGGSVQQQQVLVRGAAGSVFGPFGAFSQIFG